MVRTKQRCVTSCGPGVPKPLNPKHVNYPANAQAAYDRLERSVDRAAAALTDLRDDTSGPEHRAARHHLDEVRQWRDHAKREAAAAAAAAAAVAAEAAAAAVPRAMGPCGAVVNGALFTVHLALVLFLVLFPWLPQRAAGASIVSGSSSSSSGGGGGGEGSGGAGIGSSLYRALSVVDEPMLYVYLLGGAGVVAHWLANSEDCALTIMEHWLRGTARNGQRGGGWLDRVVGPIFGLPTGYWRARKYAVAVANGALGAARLHWQFRYAALPRVRAYLGGQFGELHAAVAEPLAAALRALGIGGGDGGSGGAFGRFMLQWLMLGCYAAAAAVTVALLMFWGARLVRWLRACAGAGSGSRAGTHNYYA